MRHELRDGHLRKARLTSRNNTGHRARVLITGGTDGLGRELARIHQTRGDNVIVIGTRAESDLPTDFRNAPTVSYIQCDLSQPNADQYIATELRAKRLQLDCVYLNAARGYWGGVEQQEWQDMKQLVDLAFLSPLLLLSAIDDLIPSGGEVKFISSVVRYLPQSNYALYAAAKAAASAAMRSLIFEHSTHYRVSALHPGAIATAFHRKSGMGTRRIPLAQQPRTVARAVVRRRGVGVIGLRNQPWRIYGKARDLFSIIGSGRRRGARHRAPQTSTAKTETVMVIGAAEGMGLELARLHGRTARKLILIDHNYTLLQRNAATLATTTLDIQCLQADVRSMTDLERITQCVDSQPPGAMRIYITAAVSAVGKFATIPRHALLNVYGVNCLPTLYLLRHLLASSHAEQYCVVLFSSLAAFVHYPGAVLYAGTKSFLSALCVALRKGRLGALAAVYPGPVATRHAARYSPDNSNAAARLLPAVAAARIIAQLQQGRTTLFLRTRDRIMAIIAVFSPRLFGAMMRAVIFKNIAAPLLPPSE